MTGFVEPDPPRTLTDAIDRLDWCCQPPHTLDQIIGIYAETAATAPALPWGATPKQLALHLKEIAALGSSHHDPTATGTRTPRIADLGPIDEAVWQLCGAARDLDDHAAATAGQAVWRPGAAPTTRTEQLRDATTRIHHANSLGLSTHDCADHDHHVWERAFIETAGWLHLKALSIWHQSKGDTQQVAQQRKIRPCDVCGPWRSGTIATTSGRCAECQSFYNHHGCERTEPIVRRADYGKGPTPAMMIEARAGTPKRKGKAS